MNEAFTEQPDGRLVAGGPSPSPKRRRPPRLNPVAVLAGVAVLIGLLVTGRAVLGGDETPAGPPAVAPPPATSHGVTQAQVDKLGDSIQARYQSGDTEVAQALLDNFMRMHPECVAAVVPGGEGKLSDVRGTSSEAATDLLATAPHPDAYVTVITVKQDGGGVKAAVLGISCEEGE